MRVYEFSKKNEKATKDVLTLLKDNGFNVTSHMSVLTQEALEFLEKHYHKKSAQSTPQEQAPKQKETKQTESVQ